MSTHDQEVRKLYVYEELMLDSDKKVVFRDSGITIYSDADGRLLIVADVALILDAQTQMGTGHQFDGSQDGVVNYSKFGAISDGDFTSATTGLIGIDTSNDRLYYRIGAADWSWISPDGGFSFPEKTCHLCSETFKLGDVLSMIVDGFSEDLAPHAIPIHRDCIP